MSEPHLAGLDSDTDQPYNEDNSDAKQLSACNFMYLNVILGHKHVTALLDTGSAINLISLPLYKSIRENIKSDFQPSDSNIVLANNQSINMYGTVSIQLRTSGSECHNILCILYMRPHTQLYLELSIW